MKVKTILVSQPAPKSDKSPYFELAEKLKVKIDFRPFIHVEELPSREIRTQKIDLPSYTAVIFTSKNAIDYFFQFCDKNRYKVPNDMRYFCQSEAIAYYLQKYVVYRKRKIYVGGRHFSDLKDTIKKYSDEKFLLPSSDKLKDSIVKELNSLKIKWDKLTLFKTVTSDLSDLDNVTYDILVFFSPTGIESLLKNFPNFKQNKTRIAAFGNSTVKAVTEIGLECNIKAPTPETPSMTMALENYIKEVNKR
ncbi:MAG: uroporphyrinogen-III synthase [Flavobacteriaceae bacterium]|nr:uroporphyrinogen-III synthase [Flavobacteriaceae bacterium]